MVKGKSKAVPVKRRSVAFKLTEEQYELISSRAEQRGVRLGFWMRGILLQAAKTPIDEELLQIQEPSGVTS